VFPLKRHILKAVDANLLCGISKKVSYEKCEGVEAYKGIVDLSCMSTMSPKDLMRQLIRFLVEDKVKICREKRWQLRCVKGNVELEIEIMKLESFDYSYLRIQKVLGKKEEYRKLISTLFNSLILLP